MKALLLAVAGVFLLAHVLYRAGLRCNVTPSMPVGLYRLVEGLPDRGDPVAFCLDSCGVFPDLAKEREYLKPGSCACGLCPLLKKLAALPGDTLVIDAEGIHILPPGGADFRLWPHSRIKTVDSQGRPVPSALTAGVIPPGQALTLGQHPGSFDSRYFGFVPLAALHKAEPVWIFTPAR